jgi:hypothetical protein
MALLTQKIRIQSSSVQISYDSLLNKYAFIVLDNQDPSLLLTFSIFDEMARTVVHTWTQLAGTTLSTDISGLLLDVPTSSSYRIGLG